MATQTTTQIKPIGHGYSEDYPCICIQDYETNKWVWFNVYEIFQNSNDLEEFTELMKKARKSVCKDEWFYSDCLYLNSIYSEHISDETLFEYLESLDDALADGHSVSLHEEFVSNFGESYIGDFENHYVGEFDTKEFSEHYIENTIDLDSIPDIIRSNIDYENVWYDLQHDYVEVEADRSTYIFRQ
jgi:antirestriction protein